MLNSLCGEKEVEDTRERERESGERMYERKMLL